MISDEERREVVRRLRELRMTAPGVTSVGHGYLWSLLWAVFGDELGELDRSDWFERICSRLADLIEPEPERTCRVDFDEEVGCWRCSECGWELTPGDEQFCPKCGARVVDE